MLRAKVTFVVGLLIALFSVAGLTYLNAPEVFGVGKWEGVTKVQGVLEVSNVSETCPIEVSSVNILAPKDIERRFVGVIFARTGDDFECQVSIQHSQPLIEDGIPDLNGCEFKSEQTIHGSDPYWVSTMQGKDLGLCMADLTFDVRARVEGFATQMVELKLLGSGPEIVRKRTTFLTDDKMSMVDLPTETGKGSLRISLTDGSRASLLTVLNILISTLVGIGISAMFEAVLAITLVQTIKENQNM